MTSSPAEVSVTRPWPAVKQPGVELFFQLLDLEGHGGLGHEQGFGGPGEGPVPRHRVENLETSIGHGS
jgi:hypothetical protein